jgi:site-specific DNA-methyltransferase (adenine-specific)
VIARNTIHEADLFDLCAQLDAGSVDMILADLPYGTTACSWDTVIPFDPMWAAFRRIIKPRGAIVLTASQPFTSALVMSWPQGFRYSWVWVKNRGTNFANASLQPIRIIEDVLVFGGAAYYPQGIVRVNRVMRNSRSSGGGVVRGTSAPRAGGSLRTAGAAYVQEFSNFPDNVLRFPLEGTGVHPTQKPVALFEYLIRTYTQPGELVFDPTAGSGTTAVAARQTGREYIVGDSSPEYVAVMRERLGKPYTLPMLELEANS